ncbi:MAG: hypothetical protein AABY13_01450 [Nanoarchaeota archaeon]
MARRAQVLDVAELVWYAVMTMFVIGAVIMFVDLKVRQVSDTRPSMMALTAEAFSFLDGGIHVLQPHTGRALPLTVDIARFDEATINAMLGHPNNQFMAAKILLTDLTDTTTCVKHACLQYWNKPWYDTYKPLTTKKGPGAALATQSTHPILLLTDSGMHPGLVSIEMVTPQR